MKIEEKLNKNDVLKRIRNLVRKHEELVTELDCLAEDIKNAEFGS